MERVYLERLSLNVKTHTRFGAVTLCINLKYKFGNILGFNRLPLFGHDNFILNQAQERLDKEV